MIQLPVKEFVYIADTHYLPYGEKSISFLQKRAKELTHYFISLDIDTIVIACHTSSTAALTYLKETFPHLTFIDMLSPTVTAAIQITKTNHVGIIATERSINSHMHKQLLTTINPHITVTEQTCPQLVPLIEKSAHKTIIKKALEEYLAPFKDGSIDTLILGCTHYAFLSDIIAEQLPNIELISAASTLTFTTLQKVSIPSITCITTGNLDQFNRLLETYCITPLYQTKKETI